MSCHVRRKKCDIKITIVSTNSTLTDKLFNFSNAGNNLAIASFSNGSAGGLDAIRPQHLKDLTSDVLG
jgi:hypothetical protein